jgi:translation initiation factor 2 gamma subunit (eIF-2gamma)
MITQEMKRILVEELGYSRKDIDAMRVELAGPIVEKRMKCPEQGMPDEWIDQNRALASRLENESKYPLKVPLLLVSTVLFGKGMSDAVVTLIKVNMDFPGASLMEEFMGANVLGIDAVCVAAGLALGVWTWKTMQDAGNK